MSRTEAIFMGQLARQWIGTPYLHQASVPGVGSDCLGLVRGLWRQVYGDEPQDVPPYSVDWAERGEQEHLMQALDCWMVRREAGQMQVGDVLLFRMEAGAVAKHCGVLSAKDGPEPKMVHAYWARAVVESWLGNWWQRRLVATFGWPESGKAKV